MSTLNLLLASISKSLGRTATCLSTLLSPLGETGVSVSHWQPNLASMELIATAFPDNVGSRASHITTKANEP
ncbi:hypothetical protein V1522DRAFT_413373 [Lipomyces starkeyi]